MKRWTMLAAILALGLAGCARASAGIAPATPAPAGDSQHEVVDLAGGPEDLRRKAAELYDVEAPADDAAYAPVTIADLAADPARYDGRLVRVRASYRLWGARPVPACYRPPDVGPPSVVDEYRPVQTWWGLTDGQTDLGVYLWLRSGAGSGGTMDTPAFRDGDPVELRGLARATTVPDTCRPNLAYRSIFLAVRRADLPFDR